MVRSEPKVIGQPRRAISLPRALSKLGLCSRTQAFAVIQNGRVTVNGKTSRDTSLRVSLEHDRIAIDGKPAKVARDPIVIALHKPAGYVTTRSDPQGRPTVYDLLPRLDRFVFPVGRLDKETSGLLIFTDDHRLGEALTNPDAHIPKTYEVQVDRVPDEEQLDALRRGIDIGRDERTRPASIEKLMDVGGSSLRIVLNEGKNRQIRRMISAVGLSVVKLCRIAIGSYSLGRLPETQAIVLTGAERLRLTDRL